MPDVNDTQGRETVTVRGTGGLEIVMDVPAPGTPADERFRADLESGALTLVDSSTPAPAKRASRAAS